MVTCSLNGGSNDTAGGKAHHHQHHQADIHCCADHEDKLPTNGHAMEVSPSIIPVRNLKIDHHDHPETVSITLYIKKIVNDSLKVEFLERNISVTFRTQDPAFLRQYPSFEPEEDFFQWSIETRGGVVPARCSFKLKPTNLELKLVKSSPGLWESLEALATTPTKAGRSNPPETWISLAPKTPPPAAAASAAVARNYRSNREEEDEEEQEDDNNRPARPTVVTASRIGYTGLGNLGNTCYMNAVIQCLANCTPLKDYFLGKQFQTEINQENPLGFGGSLAVSFAVILRQLWSGQRDSIEPSNLKTLLSNKASQFSGYAQHDAQEFMAFLLDGLHEDLNRVRQKPLTSAVESNGRPDAEVADEAWKVYKKRNDSVIVDLFQGQYKSTLVCPSCQKVSVTFDPFLYLALPMPASKSCFNVTVFFGYEPGCPSSQPSDSPPPAVRVSLWLDPSQKVEHLKQEIRQQCAGRFRWPDSEIELVQSRDGLIRRWLVDQVPLGTLQSCPGDTHLLAFETAPYEDSKDSPLVQIAVIQRLLVPLDDQTRCAACKKESSSLKRCLKCYSVAYCDKNCQKSHWAQVHRPLCKYKPTIIGQPFIITMPASALTYKRLYQTMLHYARFSVEVSPGSGQNGHSPHPEMDSPTCPSSSEENVSNGQEHRGGEEAQHPWFVIKPIDSQGQSIGKERLEDRGDELLPLGSDGDESPVFLALDWRNNERSPNYCIVASKRPDGLPVLGAEDAAGESEAAGGGNPGKLTLHRCLEQFMRSEVLSPEEAWYCPQ